MLSASRLRETITRAAPAGVILSETLWADLAARHGEAHRHYHTLDHIAAFAGHFADVERDFGWADPVSAYLALLYHDVIYDPARADNESRSAEHAVACLSDPSVWTGAPLSTECLDTVVRLIDLTACHGHLDPAELTDDEKRFVDGDMSILGTPPSVYARYEEQVAAEFLPVYPGEMYRQGRAAFLAATLKNQPIFLSAYFRDRFEQVAVENLQRALSRLQVSDR